MQISPPPAHNFTESMNESHQRQPAVHEKRRPLFLLMHSYITHQTTEPRAVCFVAIFATRAKGFGPRTWQLPSISKILYIFIYHNILTLHSITFIISEKFEHGTARKVWSSPVYTTGSKSAFPPPASALPTATRAAAAASLPVRRQNGRKLVPFASDSPEIVGNTPQKKKVYVYVFVSPFFSSIRCWWI